MSAVTAKAPASVITPVELMRLLADETRLRALLLLEQSGELCVCELTEALDVSQPKMSRHLAHLRDAGVVKTRRAGQWIHYQRCQMLPAWAGRTLAHLAAELAAEEPFWADSQRIVRAIARNRSGCQK